MRARKAEEEMQLMGPEATEELESPLNELPPAAKRTSVSSKGCEAESLTLWLLYLVFAIEGVDLQLFPASFKALETDLGFGPSSLGALSMGQALFLALCGPFWGSLADRGVSRKMMLGMASLGWGLITTLLALTSNLWIFLLLRCINGIALAALVPISQSLIADLTQDHNRGFVFGLIQCSTSVGRGLSSVAVTAVADQEHEIMGLVMRGWRLSFFCVGILSALLALVIAKYMVEPARDHGVLDSKSVNSQTPELKRGAVILKELKAESKLLMSYFKIKSFVVILTQGAFGTIPWSSLTFLTMFLQYCGLSDLHSGIVSMATVLSCGVGGVLGGLIGDRLTRWSRHHGRACTAQVSVFTGTVIMGVFLIGIPKQPESFSGYLMVAILFGLTASWAGVGCNSPMLLELVDSNSRSRIIGLLTAVNGSIAAIFGGPVVGLLSQAMGYHSPGKGVKIVDLVPEQRERNLTSLTNALLVGTIPPWVLCFTAYSTLHWTYEQDVKRLVASREDNSELSRDMTQSR